MSFTYDLSSRSLAKSDFEYQRSVIFNMLEQIIQDNLFINFEHCLYKRIFFLSGVILSIILVYLEISIFFFRADSIPLTRKRRKGNWVTGIYRRLFSTFASRWCVNYQKDCVPNLPGKYYRRVRKRALDITPTVSANTRLHFLVNFITKVTLKVHQGFT